MTRILYLLIFLLIASLNTADAQHYDMVIKGGHVIDPRNHINGLMDVAILNLRKGAFGFWDREGYKLKGKHRMECEMTIRAGTIVYDLNGIAEPEIIKKTK